MKSQLLKSFSLSERETLNLVKIQELQTTAYRIVIMKDFTVPAGRIEMMFKNNNAGVCGEEFGFLYMMLNFPREKLFGGGRLVYFKNYSFSMSDPKNNSIIVSFRDSNDMEGNEKFPYAELLSCFQEIWDDILKLLKLTEPVSSTATEKPAPAPILKDPGNKFSFSIVNGVPTLILGEKFTINFNIITGEQFTQIFESELGESSRLILHDNGGLFSIQRKLNKIITIRERHDSDPVVLVTPTDPDFVNFIFEISISLINMGYTFKK